MQIFLRILFILDVSKYLQAVECTIVSCRDIKDTTVGTLSQRITNQVHGLKGLNSKLLDIKTYLEKVATGKLPINHQIIYQLQDVFNLLPDVNLQEFVKAFYLKTNDQMLVVYLASLIRSVVALHNLINNKIANRDAEKEGQEKDDSKKEKKDEKDKDKDKEKGDAAAKKDDKKEKKWNWVDMNLKFSQSWLTKGGILRFFCPLVTTCKFNWALYLS